MSALGAFTISSTALKMKLNHTKTNILIAGVLSCFIILLVFGYMSKLSHKQNQRWLQHTNIEIKKTVILGNILSNIGYGGFIHNFKNAILRLDLEKLSIAEKQVKAALSDITHYKSKFKSEQDLLTNIEIALFKYQDKINQVEILINEGQSSVNIDKAVIVDDTFALSSVKAIITFRNELAEVISEQAFEADNYLNLIIWITCWIIIITIITCFLFIYFASRHSVHTLNKHNVLFELAPLAILAIDEEGMITSANKAAYKIFNAKKNTLVTCSIDELTPDNVRTHHKKYREDFQFSDNMSPMSERGKTFQAKKCSGELFPANISIATYDSNNGKEAIAIVQDMSDYMKSFKDAHTDTLTELPNRRDIEVSLTRAISISKREKSQLYIALIDIDFFKKINDDLGHEYGDQVLKSFALIIKKCIRESDFIGRWGGEEFLLIIENATNEGAFNLCEKIRLSIERYFEKQQKVITVSIGLTKYIVDEDEKTLFNRVDKTLYASKDNGRNQTTLD